MKKMLFFTLSSAFFASAMQKPEPQSGIIPEPSKILEVEGAEETNRALKALQDSHSIELIASDNTRFTVPEEIAGQAQTIADLLSHSDSPEKKERSISFRSLDSRILNLTAQVMKSAYAHRNLAGKKLLDAIAGDIKLSNEQIIPLLQTFDFLDFPLGVRLLAQKAVTNTALKEVIMQAIKAQKIGFNTTREIARMHYLLTKIDLPDFDPNQVTFSIRDYLDYQPDEIKRRNLNGILDLENLRLSDAEGLLDVPGLNNLGSLILSNNQLTQLPAGVFAGLNNLRELYLGSNQLTQLPAGVFAGLNNLAVLNLNYNQLTQLPAGVFAGLNNLQVLDLDNNQLTQLPAGVFAGLNNLALLNLDNNQLAQLPAGIFAGLNNLRALILRNNQLTQLPAGIFAGLNHLYDLNIENNQLTQLPAGVFAGLNNLQSLILRNNQLTQLPAGIFAGLNNLRALYLYGNQLTQLAAGVFAGLNNLDQLYLDGNQLTQLPAGIFAGLNNLRLLTFDGNHLTEENKQQIKNVLPNAYL